MADILEFKPRDKKPDEKRLLGPGESPPRVAKLKTNNDIFLEVYEDVIGQWQSAAQRNRLNEFFASKLPGKAQLAQGANYINDLNSLSYVEQKLDMRVAVFYPGCTLNNQYGWMAAFHRREREVYSTPADMASEANARALNILLFLNFEFTLRSLGRD